MSKIKAKSTTKDVKMVQATEVRQNFQEVIDKVHYTEEAMIISKHNKPWVLIQPLAEGNMDVEKIAKGCK